MYVPVVTVIELWRKIRVEPTFPIDAMQRLANRQSAAVEIDVGPTRGRVLHRGESFESCDHRSPAA
jgi:hypothetical protein